MDERWISVFGIVHANMCHASPLPKGSTQRLAVTSNVKGEQVRLHFSNREGQKPLEIGRVLLQKEGEEGSHEVRFGGSPRLLLQPGSGPSPTAWTFPSPKGRRSF